MSRIRRYPVLAVVVAALVVAGVGAGVASVESHPSLPAISTDRLVTSTIRSLAQDPSVSGQLLSHVDLGLPSPPAQGPQVQEAEALLFEAINGDHRIRFWNSRDGVRISELLPAAELSLVASRTNGRAEAWAWDSRTYAAIHLGPAPAPSDPMASPIALFDPLPATRQALAAISPTTAVSLGTPVRVAGRDAYLLRIEPRSPETLIGRIEVSIDAERRLPLRIAIFARGAGEPALSLGFTTISYGPVNRSVYRFAPPPGATVTQVGGPSGEAPRGSVQPHEDIGEYVRTFGQAWTTVIAYRLTAESLDASGGFDLRALLPFSGSLFSARLVDRAEGSWLLVGTVPQSRLASLERQLP